VASKVSREGGENMVATGCGLFRCCGEGDNLRICRRVERKVRREEGMLLGLGAVNVCGAVGKERKGEPAGRRRVYGRPAAQ